MPAEPMNTGFAGIIMISRDMLGYSPFKSMSIRAVKSLMEMLPS